jgi:ABC-2 type transport system permease protein
MRRTDAVRIFGVLAWVWTRASWQYPVSLMLLTIAQSMAMTLDVLAILVIFLNTEDLGGFSVAQVLFLYATTGVSFAIADTVMGTVERLGRHIRSGSFDVMLLRPASTLVQVAADNFSPRRLGKLVPAVVALVLSLTWLDTEWTPGRALMVVVMVICGTAIYCGIWVLGASYQFIAADAAEAMNVATYGGNFVTQYPLTVFASEWVRAMTWLVPLAFINWYPALYVFGRPDPLGYPSILQFASPAAALATLTAAGLAWRAGLRRYRSTGS